MILEEANMNPHMILVLFCQKFQGILTEKQVVNLLKPISNLE
jgi:hypothetical protein